MSAMTLTEKILAKHASRDHVQPGDNIWVDADILMTHDVCGPGTIGIFKQHFGKDAKVFARLVNISGRGACVQLSNRFRMEIGETISLDGRFLGMARRFRIVGLSSGNLHLAACRF